MKLQNQKKQKNRNRQQEKSWQDEEKRKKIRQNKIFFLLFGFFFLVVSIYAFYWYSTLNRAFIETEPISYDYVDRIRQSSGSGKMRSSLYVIYHQKKYEVNITKKQYLDAKNEKYPTLYYCEKLDYVFTKWWIGVCLNISFVFVGVFILICISYVYERNKVGR